MSNHGVFPYRNPYRWQLFLSRRLNIHILYFVAYFSQAMTYMSRLRDIAEVKHIRILLNLLFVDDYQFKVFS